MAKPGDEREETSGDRCMHLGQEVATKKPGGLDDCLRALRHPGVMMEITVQQMAFHPAAGSYQANMIRRR